MKAIRVHGRGGPDHLVYEDAPSPTPGVGEALVRVAATAIIANELTWDLTYETASGAPRLLAIPGHDLSGVVAAVGPGVTAPAVGDAVYALTPFERDGAGAEYTIALPSELAPKPRTLTAEQAAAVPLSALTAWQALFTHAGLLPGQTALIHGAAGGVGTYAVQFAHWAGARVVVTAAARHADFLRELGADETIDYATTHFEDVARDVDVVFDLVGRDTLTRSFTVVKPGGVIVSVVSPRPTDLPTVAEIHFAWFVVEPNAEQLRQIGALLDGGHVRPIITDVYPLAGARQAYEAAMQGHARGKLVLRVGE